MVLDEVKFQETHISIDKANKEISIIRKLRLFLPGSSLFRCFIRPCLNYGDFIYDQVIFRLLRKLTLLNITESKQSQVQSGAPQ